jgi:hypothetical protein
VVRIGMVAMIVIMRMFPILIGVIAVAIVAVWIGSVPFIGMLVDMGRTVITMRVLVVLIDVARRGVHGVLVRCVSVIGVAPIGMIVRM